MFYAKIGEMQPKEIILEITNHCNLSCRHCHFHGVGAVKRRKLGFMKTEIWQRVLNQIAEWDEPCSLMTHGAGEPLLYRDLEPLLVRAKEIPHLTTGFMTNGMLLTDDIINTLINLEVDVLALSIDGVIPETHDDFRQGANLERIESQVQALISAKQNLASDRPKLFFNMVGYPEILGQADDYVARWLPHAEHVTVSTFRPMGSRRLWQSAAGAPAFTPCHMLYNQMVISVEGEVGLCCEDINLDVPLGKVMESDLLTLFNYSETLNHYRQRHELGKIGELSLCADCHAWGGEHVLAEHHRNIGNLSVKETICPGGSIFRKIPFFDLKG